MISSDTITSIRKGTIKLEDVPEAIINLEFEIDDCETVIRDVETEHHTRLEYKINFENLKFYEINYEKCNALPFAQYQD